MDYNYYDTPEGDDCFLKLWYTSKVTGVTGLGISAVDVLFYSHPKGYFETLSRFGYLTLPLVGMAAAFTATTCAATNLRGKDDKLNYALGGVAAGCIFGTWRKTIKSGFVASVLLGAFAMLKKASKEDGWEFMPEIKYRERFQQDWSLRKHRPGNWVSSESEISEE
ncbi:unnamed protein product [Timema podura]|uniref:NADH dehydrogenase [ubiquinone] 1 alpha subcomplex subunit 11 n=1 Tax=Timema podura TaxID=61482 RepID=A0ABN7PHE3_TIMPD|nr:unnamed protein product [Timema podura]